MSRLAVLAALALSAPAPTASPLAPPAITGRDYQVRVLSSGLTVLVIEDHALPLVTVEIAVRNGSMTEPPERNGLSHLYEHMFFKGNQLLKSQEAFLERTRELGMVFNGTTETERVNYYFTTTADELRPSLSLMRASAESPLFDPGELQREEQVVIGEIDRDEADPFYQFSHALDLALWRDPTYKDPLGTRATVASATVEKLRLIQKRYYVPNNSLLILAGDVAPEVGFALATELFGGWARGPDPFLAHPVVEEPPLAKSRALVVIQPVQVAALEFEWEGPSTRGAELPATYAADLLSAITASPGSRFQRDLVDSGACVRAELAWQTQAHVGPISYGLEAAPDKVDACLLAALRELPRLAEPDAFSDAELRNATTALEQQKALEREAASEYAHVLSFFWSSTGLDYYDGYLPNLRQVTRASLGAYLAEYLLGRPGQPKPPFVFGALVSPELAAAGHLDQAHFEQLLGLPGRRP